MARPHVNDKSVHRARAKRMRRVHLYLDAGGGVRRSKRRVGYDYLAGVGVGGSVWLQLSCFPLGRMPLPSGVVRLIFKAKEALVQYVLTHLRVGCSYR